MLAVPRQRTILLQDLIEENVFHLTYYTAHFHTQICIIEVAKIKQIYF